MEARLGHEGVFYVAEIFGYSTRTIRRGIDKLNDDPARATTRSGSKKIIPDSEIEQNLNLLTETRTAGYPDIPNTVSTDLTPTP